MASLNDLPDLSVVDGQGKRWQITSVNFVAVLFHPEHGYTHWPIWRPSANWSMHGFQRGKMDTALEPKTDFTIRGRVISLVRIGNRWHIELESYARQATPFDEGYAPLRVGDKAEIALSWEPT